MIKSGKFTNLDYVKCSICKLKKLKTSNLFIWYKAKFISNYSIFKLRLHDEVKVKYCLDSLKCYSILVLINADP